MDINDATAPPPVPSGVPSADDRQWGMFAHLSALSGVVIPFGNIIGPLVIWQIKKDQLPGLDVHGRNATNWIISSLIYGVISGILILVVIGIPMLIALMACGIAFPIIAAVKANNGEVWKYPLTIEFV